MKKKLIIAAIVIGVGVVAGWVARVVYDKYFRKEK